MKILKSFLNAINGKEKLSAKQLNGIVKMKSSTGLGGFVDLNNDLGLMVEGVKDHDPSILMPYFYARRAAAAGMFSQGAIDKKTFDEIESLFFKFMAQVGSKLTKDEQIKFQEDSADRAIELGAKYLVGLTKKSAALMIVAAKQGISMLNVLIDALEENHDDVKNIVEPVMCADWVMKPEFCMGFFATGSWEPSDDVDMTSRKVLKYFESIGLTFVSSEGEISFKSIKKNNNLERIGIAEDQKLYNIGLEYKKNNEISKAIQYFVSAADKGNARAQYELGFIYSQGIGVIRDYEKAIRYLTLSADQGYVGAYSSLSYHFLNGLGVKRDEEKGISYLILAAEKGDIGSQCNLGGLYLDENCSYLETDINQALKWLVKAASNNQLPASFDAQYKLGCVYYSLCQGGLIPNSTLEAKKWFNVAAQNGHLEAKHALENYFLS